MAIQNLAFPELLRYPNWGTAETGAQEIISFTIDAAGEYLGDVISAPKSGTITKVHFNTKTPVASGDVEVRVETVDDATGFASGTLFGANSNALVTVTAAGVQTAVLSSSLVVTQGDELAVVLKADASSTPNVDIIRQNDTGPSFPYSIYDIGGAGKNVTSLYAIQVEYDDQTQPNIPWVRRFASISANAAINNNRRYGIRFQLPFDAVISGFFFWNTLSQNADNTILIYKPDGVSIGVSATSNGNIFQVAGAAPGYYLFPTDFYAKARTWYRLAWYSTANVSAQIYTVGINNVDHLWDVGGFDFICQENALYQPVHYTYTSAAAAPTAESDWVNDLSQITPMSLLISEISEYTPTVRGVMGLS